MTEALIRVVFGAVLTGGFVWFYVACVLPALVWHRASLRAIVLSVAVAAGVPIAYALASLVDVPYLGILGLWILLFAIWSWPGVYVRVLGGPRPYPEDLAAMFATVGNAVERLDVGDVQGAKRVLHELHGHRTARTDRYVRLWQRYLDEELRRRAGTQISSRETRDEIRAELRLITAGRGVPRYVAWPAIGLAAILGASPSLGPAVTCVTVELLLPRAAPAALADQRPSVDTLLVDPEPGASLVHDEPLNLAAAVAGRVDPETRSQLVGAGFAAGHQRVWETVEGRVISTDVFEFHAADGALSYQSAVSRYACRYSTEAFRGPGEGIGLRTYWSRGDPISEQVSWVSGNRRYVVSARYLMEPSDHGRILDLADRAMRLSGG